MPGGGGGVASFNGACKFLPLKAAAGITVLVRFFGGVPLDVAALPTLCVDLAIGLSSTADLRFLLSADPTLIICLGLVGVLRRIAGEESSSSSSSSPPPLSLERISSSAETCFAAEA